MLEKIKNMVLEYYLLTPTEKNTCVVTYQDRVNFSKTMLNRIFAPIALLGIVLFLLNLLNYHLASKIIFPFFLASIFPYYFYGVIVWLLHKEKINLS